VRNSIYVQPLKKKKMKEFLLVFRREPQFDLQLSPEQLQKISKPWQDWMGNIAAQNKLASVGNRLDTTGRVIKPQNMITDGPYVEMKETIGGYIIVKAKDLDEATELAKDCPIVATGGSVEIRPVIMMT
jgi:hypothetical protein